MGLQAHQGHCPAESQGASAGLGHRGLKEEALGSRENSKGKKQYEAFVGERKSIVRLFMKKISLYPIHMHNCTHKHPR